MTGTPSMDRVYTHRAMDTEFRLAFGEREDASLCASAASVAFGRIDALERILSRFDDTSDVAVIRALRPGQVAVVSPETIAVLVECARVCEATGGAFDPTLGAVMSGLRRDGGVADWRFDRSALDDLLARSGMQRLVLDIEHLRVAVREDRLGRATSLELDFGGIGKGFALDECRKLLVGEQFGIREFLLDAGTSTQWAQGKEWKVGVGGAWKGRTRLDTTLPLKNAAMSGSGFELQGEHVVDVRRKGAARRWAQAWAWCAESAAVADALSTAALSLSPPELSAAARALGARILVARRQPPILDRLRDPLAWYG